MKRLPPPGQWPASAWLLVLANLVPLLGVLFLNWAVFDLLVLFWLENVIIGLINVVRMLLLTGTSRERQSKWFLAPFFALHYGGFAYGHGVAILALFGRDQPGSTDLEHLWQWLTGPLWVAAMVLLLSHAVSFFVNDVRGGELRVLTPRQAMTRPYRRVVMLHITVLIGGWGVMALGSPAWALVVLVAVKIAMDLRAHLAEHLRPPGDGLIMRQAAAGSAGSAPSPGGRNADD